MLPRPHLRVLLAIFLLAFAAYARDQPFQVIVWPESGTPVLRFSFGKFKEVGSIGSERTFMTDTLAENLWGRVISNASFSLYLFDKNKVRIGEGMINLSSVGAGETVKFQTTIAASGAPASVSLVAKYLPAELGPVRPPRTVSITVNSVPQGAALEGRRQGSGHDSQDRAVGRWQTHAGVQQRRFQLGPLSHGDRLG